MEDFHYYLCRRLGGGMEITMNRDEFLKVYWKQYRLLERDLIQTDDYVSIDKDNYTTFSSQYTKLLLTTCSEMDSIAEQLLYNYTGPPRSLPSACV